jgi:hypothetical protein
LTLKARLEEARPEKIHIVTRAGASQLQQSLALAWLGDAPPTWSAP